MRILVTGAGGFIGRETVAAALARGHRVRALVRPGSAPPGVGAGPSGSGLEIVEADLRDRQAVRDAVRDADVVVHLAAAMGGSPAEQMATTVGGTAHVLDAMAAAGVPRLVAVSSIAVYDVRGGTAPGPIDESCRLESCPEERDAYCRAKLAQEALIRDAAARQGLGVIILRPGAVCGEGRLWSPRVGFRLSPRLWILTRPAAPLPLTTVGDCAEAILAAAERGDLDGVTFNVVDDAAPTRLAYARRIRELVSPRPRLLVLPWPIVRVGAAVLDALAGLRRGRRRRGGPFSLRRLDARFTPRAYSNAAIRERLGWSPRESLDAALGRLEGRSARVG